MRNYYSYFRFNKTGNFWRLKNPHKKQLEHWILRLSDSRFRFSWLHQTPIWWQTAPIINNSKSLSLVRYARGRRWDGIWGMVRLLESASEEERGRKEDWAEGQVKPWRRPKKAPNNLAGSSSPNDACQSDPSLGQNRPQTSDVLGHCLCAVLERAWTRVGRLSAARRTLTELKAGLSADHNPRSCISHKSLKDLGGASFTEKDIS